jgi:hypothetical protein
MMKNHSCEFTSLYTVVKADEIRTGRFYHGLANAKFGQGLEQESFEYLEKAREYAFI